MLSDSTNGYVYRFQIYTGKNNSLCGSSEHGLCTQAVLSLMQGIEDRVSQGVHGQLLHVPYPVSHPL